MILLLIFTLLQKSVCFPFLKSAEDSQMSHKLFFFFLKFLSRNTITNHNLNSCTYSKLRQIINWISLNPKNWHNNHEIKKQTKQTMRH